MKMATLLNRGSSLTEMFVMITVAISVFGFQYGLAVNQNVRCFHCRSNGVTDDCQDPFDPSENSALANSSTKGKISKIDS